MKRFILTADSQHLAERLAVGLAMRYTNHRFEIDRSASAYTVNVMAPFPTEKELEEMQVYGFGFRAALRMYCGM